MSGRPTDEVFVRKDEKTNDIVPSCKPADWNSFFELVDCAPAPADFLDQDERDQATQDHGSFESGIE